MQVDVISLLSKLGVNHKKHELSNQRLEELLTCLTKQDLWELCKEQPTCTAKAADAKDVMVAALVHCQLQLTALSKDHLKRICEKQGLAQTGNKDDLISRLLAVQQQQGQQDKLPAKQAKAPAKQEKAPTQKEQAPAKQAKAAAQQEPAVEHKKAPAKQVTAAAVRPPAAPGAPVVAVAVAAPAAPAAPPAPPTAAPARLQQYLCLLPKDLLQALATSWELQVRANASADNLAKALVGAGLQLTDLTVKQLQYICQVEQVPRSGTKDEIVQRLEAAAPPPKAAAAAAAAGDEVAAGLRQRALEEATAMARVVEALPDKQGSDGLMSRAAYRNLLRANRLLEDDQDVYHIISSENGGADHICNYHYAQNAALNRAIGCRHDYLNAYLAGRRKTEAAVRVSRQYGNNKGQRYEGPSAEELYRQGEATMRELRHANRDWFANNYAK